MHLKDYLVAYCNVRRVSGKSLLAGEMHAIIHVRELPPKESYISKNASVYKECACLRHDGISPVAISSILIRDKVYELKKHPCP